MAKQKNIFGKFREWIDRLLKRTHDHYSCYLPESKGLLGALCYTLFLKRVPLNSDQTEVIRQLPEDAIIVYVNKRKSYFEHLFYHARYKKEGLPFPAIAFDFKIYFRQPVSRIFRMLLAHIDYILHHFSWPDPFERGYFKTQLLENHTAFLSLAAKKDFYRRFVKAQTDPLKHLIEIQKTIDRPIYIVPQLFFFGKNPVPANPSIIDILFGPEQTPGLLRKYYTLLLHPKKVFTEVSEPVNLKNLLTPSKNNTLSDGHLALILRRNLLTQVNRHRHSITGPALKSSEELKQDILTSEPLREFMQKYAKRRDIPIMKAHKEAHEYLDEIAANYSTTWIKIALYTVRWIFKTIFDGVLVDHEGLQRVKSKARKAPLILIPCHKSHIDYLILSYTLYNQNMPCPHIFAGKNLSFWPMGPMFRRVGAFFVRRTFGGAVFYSKVFSEYIYKLLKEGFNIEVFIEGTRSRTGKLLPPQLGMLSILLNACKAGACDDLIFVPIFIGYDRVPEEKSYLQEVEGGQKEKESFSQILKARKVLKKRYGKIYLNFSEPISLSQLTGESGVPLKDMTSKQQNMLCRKIGSQVLNAIDEAGVVTPRAMAASVLLNSPKSTLSRPNLMQQVSIYKDYLQSQSARLSDTLIPDHTRAIDHILNFYAQRKLIDQLVLDGQQSPDQIKYRIQKNKRPGLEYYKNQGIFFFIPAAFTALAILEKKALQFSAPDLHDTYRFLQDMFANEFTRDAHRSTEYVVRKNIKAFIDMDIITPHPTRPDTYDISAVGLDKLKLFAAFTKTFLESYLIVLSYLEKCPRQADNKKSRFKKLSTIGNRMFKLEEIDRKEAISKITFDNAIDHFNKSGIKGKEHIEKIKPLKTAIYDFLRLLP
jgi:glycerol-3-phosphate O-acyltransferase